MKTIEKNRQITVKETRYECEGCQASYETVKECEACEAKCKVHTKDIKYSQPEVHVYTPMFIPSDSILERVPHNSRDRFVRHLVAGLVQIVWTGPGWYCQGDEPYYSNSGRLETESIWRHVDYRITETKQTLQEKASGWRYFKQLAKQKP